MAPGFTFPSLAKPETRGDAIAYANKLLFERTGRLCMTQNFEDPVGLPDWEAMIAGLATPTGMLADGRSYLGDLGGALEAFGLEPSGIEFKGLAYGLGRVRADRALPQLPEGTWWLPELQVFTIGDGRTVWYFTGQYFAAPEACSAS